MTSIREDGTVEFRFFRPGVRGVKLAGTFTGWQKKAVSMSPVGEGWWRVALKLGAGEYQFRYIADGQWFTDFAANGCEKDGEAWNSIVVVPYMRRAAYRINQDGQTARIAA